MSRITRNLIQEAANALTRKQETLAEASSIGDMSKADLARYNQILRDTNKELDKATEALANAISELEDYFDIDNLPSAEKKVCISTLKKLSDILNRLEEAADDLPAA